MIRTLRTIFILFGLLLLLPGSVFAQNRWVVGPGGYSTLEAAYQAAAPGDVILIRVPDLRVRASMSGKGVRIIGEGARPRIEPVLCTIPTDGCRYLRFSSVPAGQMLYLENLWVDGVLVVEQSPGQVVVNRVLVRRGQMDMNANAIYLLQVESALLCNSEAFAPVNTQWPCIGQPVYSGLRVTNGSALVGGCLISEGPAGTIPCGQAPFFNQTFPASWAIALSSDSASMRHFAILGCTLVGAGAVALRHDRYTLHLSGMRPYGSVRSDAGSFVDYGTNVPHVGNSIVRRESAPLPSLASGFMGPQLQIQGQGTRSGAFVFLIADLQGACLDGSPYGVEGTLAVSPGSSSLAILGVTQSDGSGAWQFSYPVSAAARAALEHQILIVQCLIYEGIGRMRASEFGIVRF